ncbi:MAG: redoxin domain-containing protein [Flavobacteriales bacterium]|nr:redoxin domain-containing protein [Flavobacteriales bacterium]
MKQFKRLDSILVKNFNGKTVNLLEKHTNTPLLLIIYNNQCLGCTGRAIPLAYEYQQQYDRLQVIGIHSNFNTNKVTEQDIKSIFTIDELPFPIYIDEDHQVFDQFNSEGTPQWILITSKGMLYRSIFGSQLNVQNRLSYAIEDLMHQ